VADGYHGKIDADKLVRDILRQIASMRDDLDGAVRRVADDAEIIFAGFAPKKSGRLSRGMSSKVSGDTAIVRADARNPTTGYDYVGVTRFGHRLSRIYPTRTWSERAAQRGELRPAALKTPFGYFASVRGFKPKGDWADRALPEIHAEAENEMERLGREFLVRFA
jgi:hypothetical protein